MNETDIKKYAPYLLGGVVIIGGIIYLRRNAGGGSTQTGGYTTLAPPDNSAQTAAAASIANARLNFASTGLGALTQLTSERMKNETQLGSETISATRDINLATIAGKAESDRLNAQIHALDTQSQFQLSIAREQNAASLALQREQDSAAINARNIDAGTQNTAVRAAASAQKHKDNTSAIVSILSIAAMIAFCYEDTNGARAKPRVYEHGTERHYYPGGVDSVTNYMGPAWRIPNRGNAHYGGPAIHHAGEW